MTAYAYIRVSTEEQAESGLGLKAQRAAIELYAEREKLAIASEHWFEDAGISGAATLEKRVALFEVIRLLRRGDTLLVAKRDRLGRDALMLGWLEVECCQRMGARIVSVAGEGNNDDSEDPGDYLFRRIVDAFSTYERLLTKARTKAAMRVKRKNGEWLGNAPFGWRSTRSGRLAPDLEEQVAVGIIVARITDGASYADVVRELSGGGMPPRRIMWNRGHVVRLLTYMPRFRLEGFQEARQLAVRMNAQKQPEAAIIAALNESAHRPPLSWTRAQVRQIMRAQRGQPRSVARARTFMELNGAAVGRSATSGGEPGK